MEIILICNDCWRQLAGGIGDLMLLEETEGV